MIDWHRLFGKQQKHVETGSRLKRIVFLGMFIFMSASPAVFAEIELDGSLGPGKNLAGPLFVIEDRFGRQEGANLFHSFLRFGLAEEEIAVFTGPEQIENIISRVTGGEASFIDGILASLIPDADLYFINPSGVMFGPNARLGLEGSLHVSTADVLYLGQSGRFDATRTELSSLTVDAPHAFGFLSESPAGISKEKSLLNVLPGKTISFIGGDLSLRDGRVNIEDRTINSFIGSLDGRVNLVSVASPGKVPIDPEGMSDTAFSRLGSIYITDSTDSSATRMRSIANVDVSGEGGGKVYIRGGRILLENGAVYADTWSGKDGQGITVKAEEELTLSGAGARITTEIHDDQEVFSETAGTGGDIRITAPRIYIRDGAQIAGSTRTAGSAGDITLNAGERIEISGHVSGPFGAEGAERTVNSAILSNTFSGAGKGGNITLATPVLTLYDRGEIRTETRRSSSGDAGNISLQADSLHLKNGGQIKAVSGERHIEADAGRGGSVQIIAGKNIVIEGQADEDNPSGLFSNTFTSSPGGDIRISAPVAEIRDNGTIQAGTQGNGNGGEIILNVETLHVREGGFITTDTKTGNGSAGNIRINAVKSLAVAESNLLTQANISSTTFGNGDAGEIKISAGDLTLHQGGRVRGMASLESAGQGGSIEINAAHVRMSGESDISAQSAGTGYAGDVRMTAEGSLHMDNAFITTQAAQAGGGNIHIEVPERMHLRKSEITARAEGSEREHGGGNVTIKNQEFIILDKSRILAGAAAGDGGNINISAAQFVRSATSILNASSELGIDGKVQVNAPDVDISGTLALPADLLDTRALLDKLCGERQVRKLSRFLVTRYAGSPPVPEDWQASGFVREDVLKFPKGTVKTESCLRDGHRFLTSIGRHAAAYALFQEALTKVADMPKRQALFHSHMADLLLAQQDMEGAAFHLDQGLKLADPLEAPLEKAHLQNNHGNLLSVREKHREALAAYNAAADLAGQTGNRLLRVQAMSNRMRSLLRQNKGDMRMLQRIPALTDKLPAGEHKTFQYLVSAEMALRIQKRSASNTGSNMIYELLRKAMQGAKAFPSQERAVRGTGRMTALPGNMAWENERLRKKNAERVSRRMLAYAKAYLGEAYALEGRDSEAMRLTREAIFLSQDMPESAYRWERQRGQLLEKRQDFSVAATAYQKAINQLRPIQTNLLRGRRDTLSMFHEHIRPVYFSLADMLLRQAADSPPEIKANLLERARDALELLKAAELENYFQDACVATARSRAVKSDRLDEHTAVLYPVLLPNRTELLLSLPDGIHQVIVPVNRELMYQTLHRFRKNLQYRQSWRFFREAKKLYDWLIAPVKEKLTAYNINTLVMVPDGPLRMIPISALHDGRKYLVFDYALAVTPGLDLTDPRSLPRRNVNILLNGLSDSVQGFPALPSVPFEVSGIQTLYEHSQVLLNQTFSFKGINRALERAPYSIVHIASHGQFDRNPKNTFLLTYDDKLTMNRLQNLLGLSKYRKKPVELLTLSACQTAVGDERAALGLAGVAIKAGARSALASLWFVNDEATSLLILEFYRQLQHPEVSKAEALRNAQIKLQEDRAFRHPLYWAPFLLIGNWL
ncbi:MAG: CHAT domain-containing protein [Gammaproteobacteria bacterium]|nr:CHAT domain-containing protein [Gammaproteobacteria bacterium]